MDITLFLWVGDAIMGVNKEILNKKLELAELAQILGQISKDKNGKLEEVAVLMTEISRLLKDITQAALELEALERKETLQKK
jgi:hypothetical protein